MMQTITLSSKLCAKGPCSAVMEKPYTVFHNGDNTPLITAAARDDLWSLSRLIYLGADVNQAASTGYGHTALIKAARLGHKRCVDYLLESGADPEKRDHEGRTALMHSASKGHLICTGALLKAGADVNSRDVNGCTVLMHAMYNESHHAVVVMLLEAGADVNGTNHDGYTTLYYASWKGFHSYLPLLISKGADVNKACCGNQTALMMASFQGNLNCAKLLVIAGADVNAVSKYGENALTLASVKANSKCVKFLLKCGSRLGFTGYFTPSSFGKRLKEILQAAGSGVVLKNTLRNNNHISLGILCRDRIRKHLVDTHSGLNLFCTVPRLGLPLLVQRHLLLCVDLDDDDNDGD